MSEPVLVSACLLGLPTRYDGSNNRCDAVLNHLHGHNLTAIPVCPEQLAGLPTPRGKTFFIRGDGESILDGSGSMRDACGNEMATIFLRGADLTLQIAQLNNCKLAILKQRSPSCGCGTIYCGQQKVAGMGVTAALLSRHNIRILTEDDFA
ncbi:MAG: DUF523 domain-containing protein [Desulfuromonadales bacterium]|nr:DUF523 domain-containing protein [Desulfuromonadales bacterium]